MHCAMPVEQSMVPVRQGFPLTAQLVPSAHAEHTPSRHTDCSSQVVPLSCRAVISRQVETPALEHTTSPR